MTDEQDIKKNLCLYDSENPNNNLDAYDEDDGPEPRNNCACDNCFYGRDKLAVQLLETLRQLDETREVATAWEKIASKLHPAETMNMTDKRETIKDTHDAIKSSPYPDHDTLTKLQTFLKTKGIKLTWHISIAPLL